MNSANSVAESRRYRRRLVMQRAFAKTGIEALIPCVVVDISEGGALLEFEYAEPTEDRFHLVTNTLRGTIECDVVHRSLHGIGVRFISSEWLN